MMSNDRFDFDERGEIYRPEVPDAADADETQPLSDDADAQVPGFTAQEPDAPEGRGEVDMPGQEASDNSAAGSEQGGEILETVNAPDTDPSNLPGEEGVGSSGDSMGDDDDLPGAERVRRQEARLNGDTRVENTD
jgi:hypothetical protein